MGKAPAAADQLLGCGAKATVHKKLTLLASALDFTEPGYLARVVFKAGTLQMALIPTQYYRLCVQEGDENRFVVLFTLVWYRQSFRCSGGGQLTTCSSCFVACLPLVCPVLFPRPLPTPRTLGGWSVCV